MEINKFLEKNIEGYLFCDVEKMLEIKLKNNESEGACGYPIVMTILAGMELLGFLLGNKEKFSDKSGNEYFKNYWKNYFCKLNKKYAINGIEGLIRNLVRHGLAHNFLTKPNILIYKEPKKNINFLDKTKKTISIEVYEFFYCFKESYIKFVKNGNKKNMQKRLDSIIDIYSKQTDDFFKNIDIKLGNLAKGRLIYGASFSVGGISPSGMWYDEKNKRFDNY